MFSYNNVNEQFFSLKNDNDEIKLEFNVCKNDNLILLNKIDEQKVLLTNSENDIRNLISDKNQGENL